MNRILKFTGKVLVGVGIVAIGACLGGLILGFPIKWLWNYLMPTLFGLQEINFWQALAIFALSYTLFQGKQSNTKEN